MAVKEAWRKYGPEGLHVIERTSDTILGESVVIMYLLHITHSFAKGPSNSFEVKVRIPIPKLPCTLVYSVNQSH